MAFRSKVQIGTPSSSGEQTNTNNLSFTHTCEAFGGERRYTVITVGIRDPTSGTDTQFNSATYAGQSILPIADNAIGGSGSVAVRMLIFTILNPTPGSNAVSITFDGVVSHALAYATTMGFSDANAVDSVQASTAATATITDQADGTDERSAFIAHCVVNDPNGSTLTLPVGPSVLNQTNGGIGNIIVGGQVPSTTTFDITFTHNNGADRAGLGFIVINPCRRRSHAT